MHDDLKQALKRFLPGSLVAATRPLRLYFHPQRRFDRRLGVDTSGDINADSLDVNEALRPHASGYEPTPPAVFHRIIRNVPIRPEDFAFVDMGSGKGAALLYALSYPFRRIVGVELSPPLHAIAQRNLEHVQRNGARPHALASARPESARTPGGAELADCALPTGAQDGQPGDPGEPRARSLCMSAADFDFPPEPLVVYLGNPFKGALLDTVVSNLDRSLRSRPRAAFVVYYHRLSRHGAWDAAPFLETIRRESDHTIYRNRG